MYKSILVPIDLAEPVLRTVNAMLFAVMSANLAELTQHFEVTGQVAATP